MTIEPKAIKKVYARATYGNDHPSDETSAVPPSRSTEPPLPLRRAPGGTSTTRAAAFADHGDAVGRTAPLRALALHSLRASKEFATVPATLAALAAAYVRHGGAIGGAACATITRALERADDAWAVEWYVFVSVFALYALTTAPSVAGGDSGELLAESCSLGTAHPPGYPLFTLLYHIPLTYMPAYLSPAMWANLFTAMLGAGASAVVCAITREALRCGGQCGRSISGASAGYLFAFSP